MEHVLNRRYVFKGRGLCSELDVGDVSLKSLRKYLGNCTIICQVTLVSHYHDKHLIALVLKMLIPLIELIKRALVVDRVAQNTYTGTI